MKKLSALILSLALSAALLAGCGASASSSASSEAVSSEVVSETVSEEDGSWWCLTDAAGEMTSVGVADIELHDGDSYAFTYTK